MDITLYAFEDEAGNEDGTFTTLDINEARDYARRARCRIVAHTYEWADSEVLEDYA